ncbi:glycosyltransferase family 2 protein [Candidatus Roizmanbacteria bacterium]|nr:glycosyltransferase family 2 protein [Candidatus Roizmanbacteria bacterium]
MKQISFLIVNWNGGEMLKKCVQSIRENAQDIHLNSFEIIIVDNHSDDFDTTYFSQIKVVRIQKNTHNLGFAKGTNQSTQLSSGNLLFLLNNDIILKKNCLKTLLQELSSGIDCVVPQLLNRDGSIQKNIYGLPTLSDILYLVVGLNFLSPKFDNWMRSYCNPHKKQIILNGQPMFSCMLLTRDCWDTVGEMDEQFPLLWNDTDWFYRFNALGKKCLYVPSAQAIHVHGMSVNKRRYRKVWESTKGMYRYFLKNSSNTPLFRLKLFFLCTVTFTIRIVKETIHLILQYRLHR